MNLKNYTTEVQASRSMDFIEQLLVRFGATNIMKEFGPNGRCSALSFIVPINGMKLPFRLPAKSDKIYNWLKKQKPNGKEQALRDQAERIAWKQNHEWLHLQLSMIEIEQAEPLELFFPFLYDPSSRQSYYDKLKSQDFKGLLPDSNSR